MKTRRFKAASKTGPIISRDLNIETESFSVDSIDAHPTLSPQEAIPATSQHIEAYAGKIETAAILVDTTTQITRVIKGQDEISHRSIDYWKIIAEIE